MSPDLSSAPGPTPSDRRAVTLERTGPGAFRLRNARGGVLDVGTGPDDFSPVELLLAALAGCAAVNIEEITSRRAEPTSFAITASGRPVRDAEGGRLEDLVVDLAAAFGPGEAGDAARAILARTVRQTHERICTVSRTVERGTPVDYRIDGAPPLDPTG